MGIGEDIRILFNLYKIRNYTELYVDGVTMTTEELPNLEEYPEIIIVKYDKGDHYYDILIRNSRSPVTYDYDDIWIEGDIIHTIRLYRYNLIGELDVMDDYPGLVDYLAKNRNPVNTSLLYLIAETIQQSVNGLIDERLITKRVAARLTGKSAKH